MNCPKCKELIKTGDVFCRSCGEKLNIDEPNEFIEAEEKIKNEQEIQNTDSESNQEKSITFDDLVDAYIGKKASKLMM